MLFRSPGRVCGRRSRIGHWRASSWKSVKTCWEEPEKGESSRSATSRLSRNIHRSVASFAPGEVRPDLAPSRALSASASKTSTCRPRDIALRSVGSPYWYVTNPHPVNPSVDSLLDLSKNTWMSLSGIVKRKAWKSFTAITLVLPSGS